MNKLHTKTCNLSLFCVSLSRDRNRRLHTHLHATLLLLLLYTLLWAKRGGRKKKFRHRLETMRYYFFSDSGNEFIWALSLGKRFHGNSNVSIGGEANTRPCVHERRAHVSQQKSDLAADIFFSIYLTDLRRTIPQFYWSSAKLVVIFAFRNLRKNYHFNVSFRRRRANNKSFIFLSSSLFKV